MYSPLHVLDRLDSLDRIGAVERTLASHMYVSPKRRMGSGVGAFEGCVIPEDPQSLSSEIKDPELTHFNHVSAGMPPQPALA